MCELRTCVYPCTHNFCSALLSSLIQLYSVYLCILFDLFAVKLCVNNNAKQKHPGCKKVRGQSEAALQIGMCDQKL